MRLFISINFNDEIKRVLSEKIETIKENSLKGNYTREENMHLTLVFIGKTKNADSVKEAMDKELTDSFNITISGIGKFKRNGGDIYFAGVKKCDELSDLYDKLSNNLSDLGFDIQKRQYTPHITLAREVKLKNEADFKLDDIDFYVDNISLMKSMRIDGKLIYEEIYNKKGSI